MDFVKWGEALSLFEPQYTLLVYISKYFLLKMDLSYQYEVCDRVILLYNM